MRHPEWAGYLAAFDTYLDAKKRDDPELAEQARTLMGHFADELIALNMDGKLRPRNGVRPAELDLSDVLDYLGLADSDA